jgi:site-specific DNA-cytosine methylase
MKPLRVLSLFDGISAGQVALRNLGIPVESYTASEIEPNAIKVTQSNFPNTIQVGDVTKLHITEGQYDLILCGSPCYGFSQAGMGKGLDDPRSKLFWEFVRLLEEGKPKYFLLENNKMKKMWEDIITKAVGVSPVKIPANLVSACRRDRLYWSNIPNITIPSDKGIMLKSIIGEYSAIWVFPRGYNKGGMKDYRGKLPTVTCSSYEHNFMPVINGVKRKFTSNEIEQAMGFPIDYTKGVSESQRIKKLGNTWCVPVIDHILKGLLEVSE